MKQFMYLICGGLCAVVIGVFGAIKAPAVWNALMSHLDHANVFSTSWLASVANSEQTDGTSITGLKRLVRYSASEEEDLINAAGTSNIISNGGISAHSYILQNETTGKVISSQNPDQLLPIASLTKLVTAAVARKLIPANDHVTITRDIVAVYGNTAQLRVGETYQAGDLFYPLLMVSSNDAAEALARDYGRLAFIQAMNDFAQSIGAYRTIFADPSGLSPNNESTAHDIALILNWLRLNDPDIISITQLKSKTIRSHTWLNPAHFLSWSNYLGGKNGYTTEANRTGAELFSMGAGRDVYAVVVLGSSARDPDVIQLLKEVSPHEVTPP